MALYPLMIRAPRRDSAVPNIVLTKEKIIFEYIRYSLVAYKLVFEALYILHIFLFSL